MDSLISSEWWARRESNPHRFLGPSGSEPDVSANSTTRPLLRKEAPSGAIRSRSELAGKAGFEPAKCLVSKTSDLNQTSPLPHTSTHASPEGSAMGGWEGEV